MFVTKFEAADADHNLFLAAAELKASMADFPALTKVFADDAQLALLVNDISGRIDKESGTINFFEWMFVR